MAREITREPTEPGSKPPLLKKDSNPSYSLLSTSGKHHAKGQELIKVSLQNSLCCQCPFCKEEVEETLYHAFFHCPWLQSIFTALDTLFVVVDLNFSKLAYLFSILYQAWLTPSCLNNFLLDQAKMVTLKSHQS